MYVGAVISQSFRIDLISPLTPLFNFNVFSARTGLTSTKYDLISNIVHEGKAGEGVYRLHVHRKVEEIW